MNHSTGKPTKAEARRMDEIRSLGCCACAALGLWVVADEVHHILRGGRRLGHWYTIPLCRGHHRSLWSMAQRLVIPKHKLVSIADGRKRLIQAYPTERQMWEKVQEKLKLSKEWAPSKIEDAS